MVAALTPRQKESTIPCSRAFATRASPHQPHHRCRHHGLRPGIVKQQAPAENGEIVCALIDGEATLKRFFKKDGVVTLKAENEKYAPIIVSEGEFRIAGRVIGLLRKF